MTDRPLPQHLSQRLIAARAFAQALKPGATRIDYIDFLATTPLRWHMFQVYVDCKYGIMQLDDTTGRFNLEFPYSLLLGCYNAHNETSSPN